MSAVEHHSDNSIYVRSDNPEVFYTDTTENFELDFGVPFPPLPSGIDERFYTAGKRHALNVIDRGTVDGGPMPWIEGDALVNQLDTALANQNARQQAELDAKVAALQALNEEMIASSR